LLKESNMPYDIIIIGAGTAGMPCAICAAQRGKKVLVIEKDNKVGGTLHLTAGHLSAANTNRQKEKGIEDSTEQHYADIERICKHTMDATIAKKAVDLAPSTVDWLADLGYIFHELTPLVIHGHEPYSVARTYFGKDDYAAKDITGSGKMVLKTILPLWNTYIEQGTITVLLQHGLVSLKKEENAIKSIVVEDIIANKNIDIPIHNAKLVITTGGYAANNEFYQKSIEPYEKQPELHFPKRLVSTANMFSQGDGVNAITNIGGQFINAHKHISTLGGVELEPNSGRASFWDAWARVSNSVDRMPREIYINENGERFMNEVDLTVDERERLVLQQPNQRFYVVFDEKALQAGPCIVVQWNAEKFREETQKEKCCWQAATLEALANKINIPVNNFIATAHQFNDFVTQKKDEDFNRSVLEYGLTQAPYYALLVYAYSLISFGGIKVNEQLQVLDKDNSTITNLYAAGEILGAAATSGNAFCGGMLLTPAISFGKWLGEHL
jgi:succinate dehydrogenase/fumarate reductase flavoprotein subunit